MAVLIQPAVEACDLVDGHIISRIAFCCGPRHRFICKPACVTQLQLPLCLSLTPGAIDYLSSRFRAE